jgi:hypothetical protein
LGTLSKAASSIMKARNQQQSVYDNIAEHEKTLQLGRKMRAEIASSLLS